MKISFPAILIALALAAVGLSFPVPAVAATAGTIQTPGPLTTITTSTDLNCAVRHLGDNSGEFYGDTACGTFVAMGGTLYGPANVPAGSNASPRVPFVPISQAGPTGLGTEASPFIVTTTVRLGTTDVTLKQRDFYVTGRPSYDTVVELTSTATISPAILYRAGDCYLADSDVGKGAIGDGWVACVSGTGRIQQWIDTSTGAAKMEGQYGQVWSRIGSQRPFPNTCDCDSTLDNGAGLSWSLNIAPSAVTRISHRMAFATGAGTTDSDGDGLLDTWETNGLDVDADGNIDVDLKAMGATPDHKDLFVEVDWMDKPNTCILWMCWGARSFAPQDRALRDVQESFSAAPVTNPDGRNGVRIHIDSGPDSIMNPDTGQKWGTLSKANAVAHTRSLGSRDSNGDYNWTAFNHLKSSNFVKAREDVFHYSLYADTYAGSGSSGIANVGSVAGDSFLLTDGQGWGQGFTLNEERGTFMHEFGHTLGLWHSGESTARTVNGSMVEDNFKPNYHSIMNYLWQLKGLPSPFRSLDYSRDAEASIDENALGRSVNCDPTGKCDPYLTVLKGFDDWEHLKYDGGAVGAFGSGDLDDQNPPPTSTPALEQEFSDPALRSSLVVDGDGRADLVQPAVVFADEPGQSISVDVNNVSDADATYSVKLSGGFGNQTKDLSLAKVSTNRVEFQVSATTVQAGTVPVTITLLRTGEVLSESTGSVTVRDTTPANAQELKSIQDALNQPQTGMDDATRQKLVEKVEKSIQRNTPVSFTDVKAGDAFYEDISWLAQEGISTGWVEPDGSRTYRPVTPVNRDAMAAFMYRLAGSPAYTPPVTSPFTDISPSSQFYKEISWLASRNISTGWTESNGTKTFRPLTSVNRDAMAAFMYRFAGLPAFTPPSTSPFADINSGSQFYKEMSWLANTGISTGWTEANRTKTYRPVQAVNRDAMAAFMHRYYVKFGS